VYRAAREGGLRIPTDLSVVGFDDLPIAALADPPMTTVRQPLAEMAVAATELALALGRGEKPPQVGSSDHPDRPRQHRRTGRPAGAALRAVSQRGQASIPASERYPTAPGSPARC
jgi:hypothetical protein